MGSIFSGINNPGVDIEELTSTELTTIQEIDGVSHAVGTILVSTATVWSGLTVGTDTFVLTADSGEASGLKWVAAAGGGDVSKVGTPVDSQIGVWTGDGTIEGDAALTFDTSTDSLVIAASGNLLFGAITILDDTTGTMTLSNIDALDPTTEATVEAAIDTLANLTSVQGHTVTLTGDLIRSGAHSLTLTTTGVTSVAFPTSGTLLANVVEDTTPQLGANLDAQSAYKIVNLIDPTSAQDVATKNYVDLAIGFQFDYFFNNTISVGSYYGMTDTDLGGAESTDLEVSISAGTDDQELVEFISPSGQPGIEELSAGVYSFHFHAERTSGNSTVDAIYVELYKYETNTSETLLATTELSGVVLAKEEHLIHFALGSAVTIDSTDRLLVKFYANTGSGGGSGSNVEIYVEGTTSSRFSFQTSSEILSSLFLRQDGTKALTANWDVGAFTITGTQFISDIAGGTPPFVVTSSTEVTNLTAATATAATTAANLSGTPTLPDGTAAATQSVNDNTTKIATTAYADTAAAAGGATVALDNLNTVAINESLVSDTYNTDDLGTAAKAWADLYLGNTSVIDWSTAASTSDMTLTHSANVLTFAGGTVALGTATATSGLTGNVTGNCTGSSGSTTGNAATVTGFTPASGSLTLSGAHALTLTTTAGTNVTLPTTGTLITNTVATLNSLTSATSLATLSALTSVGALGSGSITSGFTSIDVGSGAIQTTGTATLRNIVLGTDGTVATMTLAEKTSIALDPAGGADGDYSGITVTGISGYSQDFGDLVTLDKDDSRWEFVDISVAATVTGDARGMLGIVVSTGTDGNACTVLLSGIIRADVNFPALTIGANVYASTTGDIVVTQPSTTDHIIRIVGAALTANEIYFRPDYNWITHV